jgi:hypothetical protein
MHKQQLGESLRLSRRDNFDKLNAIFFSMCSSVDSPKSLAAWILFREGEYYQLVTLECNPLNYQDTEGARFADDYLIAKFLSKFPEFKHPDLDPEAAALSSFYEYEEMCKITNQKLTETREGSITRTPFMSDVLHRAKRKISRVLGAPDLDYIARDFGWGPGATSVAKASLTSAYVKYALRLDVTVDALMMGRCCVNSTPSWVNCQLQTDEFPSVAAHLLDGAFHMVRGNEVVLVPKNAKTHRVIAKEPHVNSYLQRGFGRYIRKRLKRYAGIDLDDQTRNQQLAREGSLTGLLATIDLSGASDTISLELVKQLLPGQWLRLLMSLRSSQGKTPEGTWKLYHKFSSMGNGFTFELESLIFWALCESVAEISGSDLPVSVYGDDLIVPVSCYEEIVAVIDYCGFRVNASKSFSSGVFRESCGKDYFNGQLVRPIFLKENLDNVESLYRMANSLRRYAHRRRSNGCDARFRQSWELCVSFLPSAFRNYKIPEGVGDGGIVSNFDEATPCLIPPNQREIGWEGYFFKSLIRQPVKRRMSDKHAGYTAVLSASKVFREDKAPLNGFHSLRGQTRLKVARIHTRGWYDFGPWI